MANSIQLKTSLLFTFSILILFPAFAQRSKINPALFRTIEQNISVTTPQNTQGKNISRFLIEPSTKAESTTNPKEAEKMYDCIIYTRDAKALKDSGIIIGSVLPNFATATLTSSQILSLATHANIQYIDLPKKTHINNDISAANSGATLLHDGMLNNTAYDGKGVIVAIFDTGIDWKHLDFRDKSDINKSRILCIWDQTLTPVAGEVSAPGYTYGVYYTQAQINAELASPSNSIREKDSNGHGTHVSGIAAGNGNASSGLYAGMAPDADIIFIKGGDGSFSETNEINAIVFLKHMADSLNRPIVLNMSIGGQYSAHDGTDAAEQTIDNFTSSGTGRVVVIAAGNENGTNEHNRLTLPGNGTVSVNFTVQDSTTNKSDYVFDYLAYLNDNSNISAVVIDPLGVHSDTVTLGNATETMMDTAGSIRVQMASDIDPANNNTYLELYIDIPSVTSKNPQGIWALKIINNTANSPTLDGWITEKGDKFPKTILGNGDNNYLVGSPGTATTAITAASYNSRVSWRNADGGTYAYFDNLDSISNFSSRGPRRDGVNKPDLAAPGAGIISSLSSDATPGSADIINPYYQLEQGTSMASPAIAGCVALLLQANPNLTASQIKSLLQTNASQDYIATAPFGINATWGAGKLDVYKAATAIFNTNGGFKKLYKYDNSSSLQDGSGGDGGILVGTYHIATRFSPDTSGKLAGVYFQPSTSITSLVLEIRNNKSGHPGDLLGSVNIDSTKLSAFTINYVDLDSLNIPIKKDTDYFVVLYKNPSLGSGSNWSIFYNSKNPAGRSFISSDGNSWSSYANNFRIRMEIYGDGQPTDSIASFNSDTTHDVNSNNQFRNNQHELIAQVTPSGTSAVSGNITTKVWIDSSVPGGGAKYVARHYQITPEKDTATASAKVTLYFKQSEFDNFNAANPDEGQLPVNANDAAGISNLLVGKYSGVSSDNTGLPATYNSTEEIIDPADSSIVWNDMDKRWEVTLDVDGFSGFFVQTLTTALPVRLEYFTASAQGKTNVLNWKVSPVTNQINLELQRSFSLTRSNFIAIHTEDASALRCQTPFEYTDPTALDTCYYRLKMTENNGSISYSNIVSVQRSGASTSTLFPNVLSGNNIVYVYFAGDKGSINIYDVSGKAIYTNTLSRGTQNLILPKLSSGIYLYIIKDTNGKKVTGKIIVR